MTGERVVTRTPPMMIELVAELAALAASQGWDLVGIFTEDDGSKRIGIRNAVGDGLQISVTPGKVTPRQ